MRAWHPKSSMISNGRIFRSTALLKEAGIRRADLGDPDSRVSYAAVIALMERAATLLGEPGFRPSPRRLPGHQRQRHPGLRDAQFGDASRCGAQPPEILSRVGDGEDIEVDQGGPHVKLRFRERDPALRGLRQNSEYFAALIVRACRDMTRQRISPVRAEFMHPRPNARIDYEAHLGCAGPLPGGLGCRRL